MLFKSLAINQPLVVNELPHFDIYEVYKNS